MVTRAQVYGDIAASDDSTHPLGPEKNFNESMYFNFFDTRLRRGGFLRIGNRANEKYAEVTLCLYEPDGQVLFNYKRPEIATNDAYDAGGMRFETLEPLVRHRTTYEGSAVYLATPEEMSDPGQAFRENPHKKIAIDLVHEAVGPVYGSTGADRQAVDPEKEFAKAHYEQHMKVTGSLAIDGETYAIDAFGLRDHSWGPRYWQNIYSYRWLTCSFGPALNIMVSEVCPNPESRSEAGVVIRDGVLERIVHLNIDSQFDEDRPFHRSMTADLELESGEHVALEGRVLGFIPLRNRREGHVTHIGEGMTEYKCLGHTGLGISEYLDQVQ
ncbi:MAG TPA: hypothetical protein VMT90_05600 [Dehalococcoidia bacterium]|jgi:hypothetical protein|nr:hypothetical protein [Dehalococcoidia bacterium]